MVRLSVLLLGSLINYKFMMFSWNDTFTPLTDVWHGVANFVPTLLVAIIIAIIGWIVGAVFYKVVSELIKLSKLDSALKSRWSRKDR